MEIEKSKYREAENNERLLIESVYFLVNFPQYNCFVIIMTMIMIKMKINK